MTRGARLPNEATDSLTTLPQDEVLDTCRNVWLPYEGDLFEESMNERSPGDGGHDSILPVSGKAPARGQAGKPVPHPVFPELFEDFVMGDGLGRPLRLISIACKIAGDYKP